MATETESHYPGRYDLRSSQLRRPIIIGGGPLRAYVNPDGSVRSVSSLDEKRSIFGVERLFIYKVQAGVVVQAQRPDWVLEPSPDSVKLSGTAFGSVEFVQSIQFYLGASSGYTRTVQIRNNGSATIKIRLVDLHDPTAAHSLKEGWGSLGLNAFNRGSHVAMDEVSDRRSGRVIGANPQPQKYCLTTDMAMAERAISAGELPEPASGMSGQVVVLSEHDFEIQPGQAKEVVFVSIYNGSKLEGALADFSRLQSGASSSRASVLKMSCSSPQLTKALEWAAVAVRGALTIEDALDTCECIVPLAFLDSKYARAIIEGGMKRARKDGSQPHSLDPSMPGVLETALFIQGASIHALLLRDKKVARGTYPAIKKAAGYLASFSKDGIQMEDVVPQGWRRHAGAGHPSGELSEVSLAVSGALRAAASLARFLSKSTDAGKFKEASELVAERVRRKLTDERGYLALCLDPSGKLHSDETIDMAVACYRSTFSRATEEAAVHRVLEKDFETPYGPRTVPSSNQLYFHESYGSGQLGGVWHRAVLAHAILAYRIGLGGLGSLELEKVARFITEDTVKLGAPPGFLPYWIDVASKETHWYESDPVAAGRLIEAFVGCELGIEANADRVTATPSKSTLNWAFCCGMEGPANGAAFVARGTTTQCFVSGGIQAAKGSKSFARTEILSSPKGVTAVSFSGPGQYLCIGNSEENPVKTTVSFPPRDPELSKKLSVPFESLDKKEVWTKVGTLRVGQTMSFDCSLGPGEWKVYRVSTA